MKKKLLTIAGILLAFMTLVLAVVTSLQLEQPAHKQRVAGIDIKSTPHDEVGGQWAPLSTTSTDTKGHAESGRITAIAIGPRFKQTDPSDVWIGAADGGLWHSRDGGNTWIAVPTRVTIPELGVSLSNFPIGSLAIDASSGSPYTIYAGTGEANHSLNSYWGAGILKSTDGGATWHLYGFTHFGGLSIAKIAIDPQNSTVLLAAVNYNLPSVGTTPPSGGDTHLDTGIWRSTDAGQTWTHVLSPYNRSYPDAGTDVVFNPANPRIAFAGIGNVFQESNFDSDAGLYESKDAGYSWSPIDKVPMGSDDERVSLGISQDGNRVYVVITSGGINPPPDALLGTCDDNRPHNNKKQNKQQSTALGALLGTYDDTTKVTCGVIYVGTYDKKKATYGWLAQLVPHDMVYDGTDKLWWYASTVGVDAQISNGATVYIGGEDWWVSRDGGKHFNNFSGGHADQHAIAFTDEKSGSPPFYIGNDGGIWQIDEATNKFSDLNNGYLNITQFYSGSIGGSGNSEVLLGGAQDNGELKDPMSPVSRAQIWKWAGNWPTNDGSGADAFATIVDPTSRNIVYGEVWGDMMTIEKSTDGGTSWNSAPNDFDGKSDYTNFDMPFIMSPNNHNELLLGTDRVFRTTDGAASKDGSWSAIGDVLNAQPCGNYYGLQPFSHCPISALAIASDDSYIYAGDNAGHLFAHSGNTWFGGYSICPESQVFERTSGRITGLAVKPNDPLVVYATCSAFTQGAGHVFKITFHPASSTPISIQDISNGLPNVPFESIVLDPNTGDLIAGSDIGAFISVDDGTYWSQLGTDLPGVFVSQLFFNAGHTELFAATMGRGMWEYALPLPRSTSTPRVYHTATPLDNGKVLVVGGEGSTGTLATAELYDPSTNIWSPTYSLATAREGHTATLLPNGKVLVVGGGSKANTGFLATAELYDPSTGSWSKTGSLSIPRQFHTATRLLNGKVLVVGGFNDKGNLGTVELYDPSTGTWSKTDSTSTARAYHTATLLPDGKVLVAGGMSNSGTPLVTAELYDPTTGTWSSAVSMSTPRQAHTATLLPNGKLLVAGGYSGSILATAELYDPSTGTWSPTGSMSTARVAHTATLLPNGKLLVVGGYNYTGTLATAEFYDPSTGTWLAAGPLTTAHQAHTTTLLSNGKVLVVGGGSVTCLASAELFS